MRHILTILSAAGLVLLVLLLLLTPVGWWLVFKFSKDDDQIPYPYQ